MSFTTFITNSEGKEEMLKNQVSMLNFVIKSN